MKRLWNTIAGLRLGFEEHFRGAGSISLFVGLACNLAFVGQVYFWPSMWHTTAFMFSYTDASYVAELLCALMLGWRLRRGGRLVVGSRLLWVLALLVQATLVLYCALFGAGIHVPEPVNWVCGAIFGVYLPVAMTSWFAVHIDRRMPSATRPRRRFCSASPSSRPSPLPVSGATALLMLRGISSLRCCSSAPWCSWQMRRSSR